MDLDTAKTILSVLSPFAAKGIEKIVEKSAEEGFNERKKIFEKVKSLFKYDEPRLLSILQESEFDDNKKSELEGELKTHLQYNPETTQELKNLLLKIPQKATDSYEISGNKGTGIIIGKMIGGKVTGKKLKRK